MGQSVSGAREKLPGFLGGTRGADAASSPAGAGTGAAASEGKVIGEDQYTVDEALRLQKELLDAFKEESFQKLLWRAKVMHPRSGQRNHPDAQAFHTQLQGLLLHVYRTILPKKPWCLEPGWKGVRQMMHRMAAAGEDQRVILMKEEINASLGLPRHTVLRPPPEEPVFVPTPDGSGGTGPKYTKDLLVDDDGDQAHEFWEEDRPGGEMRLKDIAVSN
mmetsp:Transcript_29967/g.56114  ORF Transcript_29967/g.56114 Transcript_29967/m.56114 type:complete len:218 (+) Transcript_29967:186-839(+)